MSSLTSSSHVNGSCLVANEVAKNVTSAETIDKFATNGEATDDVKATQQQIKKLEVELKHARDALSVLKADRKRLKAEKFDVLNQMKQLYATLEDKEVELRDFIRTYEKRMRESEATLRQLVQERDGAEREKWVILRHARDEAERCLNLTNQLTLRDTKISQMQEEMSQLRQQLNRQEVIRRSSANNTSNHNQLTQRSSLSSVDSSTIMTSEPYDEPLYSRIDHSSSTESQTANREGAALVDQLMADVDALSVTSYSTIPSSLPTLVPDDDDKSGDVVVRPSVDDFVCKSNEKLSISSSFSSRTLGKFSLSKTNGINAWGSISRVFSRNKHQRKMMDFSIFEGHNANQSDRRNWSPRESLCTTPLTEETMADRFRFWDEAQSLSMDKWKAGHVLAWMEFSLGMGQYVSTCAGNIKSGKVLLELTEDEMESGLGLTHAMHRKKLRLAVEELRQPSTMRYPHLSSLGNTWVTSEWLADIGLTQYCDNFSACLMDGRLLDNLTKRELERYLGVTRKSHQNSIVHGITFLRMMKYDRQLISDRRKHSENSDNDPLVWTNQRLVTWLKSIDLAEYCENLKNSGVHGGLLVLDPSFNGDSFATALGISQSKNIVRRHLATELESLVQVEKVRYEQRARQWKLERKKIDRFTGGSLGRSFSRSFTAGLSLHEREETICKPMDVYGSRTTVRASLSRAFGRKVKQELLASPSLLCVDVMEENGVTSSKVEMHSPSAHSPVGSRTLKKLHSSKTEKHRRVKSSSDIGSITITRV